MLFLLLVYYVAGCFSYNGKGGLGEAWPLCFEKKKKKKALVSKQNQLDIDLIRRILVYNFTAFVST